MTNPTTHNSLGQTHALASFAASLQFSDIPTSLVKRIKLHVLDGLGVCLHGAQLPWTKLLRDLALVEGGTPVAGLWGTGKRTSLTQAVLVNSTAGHAFEMDDIHKESVLHPNSIAVPVALALAEVRSGTRGRDVLTAIVAGYEVGLRVGNAATTALFLNGFHPQGTTGAFISAATAANLLRLDAKSAQHALGIAGSLGSGLMAAQEGAMVKRLHAGRASQSGLMAALLGARGFTGIENVLEVDYGGFLSSFSRDYCLDKLTQGLGSDWEAGKVGFKMYPNVTSIHTSLDALKQIISDGELSARDIESIEVGCGHMTFVHTAWQYKPGGVTAAQMNLAYGMAMMALYGDVTAAHYDDSCIANADVLAFIPRIRAFEDPELEQMGPAYRHACRVSVRTFTGQVFKREVLARRGSPEDDVSPSEIERKFRSNVATCMSQRGAQRIVEIVANLEELPDLAELSDLLGSKFRRGDKSEPF
ncbi:MmgE/PrpD family protein [Paraburkholderia fungorum]|uniref:2-methylcitrate dehydratase PrpD n=1 Tax=Paraburkholderia fungorum TaxID=134537 RepID=A0A420FKF1_9BURK|nr:MmgE/PrpD family protein [Paraburkholderia fungorum]RKF33373.1 hypothetical protein BCY88_09935 [Paraburkholderia fungorum]